MSFVDAQAGNANRAKAVIMVGGVHALLAVGLVAGLAVTSTFTEDKNLPTTIFKKDPLPPPPPPEVVDQTEDVPSYVPPKAPDRPVDLTPDPVVVVEPVRDTTPADTVRYVPPRRETPVTGATAAPTSAPTPPRFAPAGPAPRNGPSGWISNDDYPSAPLRRGEEGTANYRLVIGSDGRVDACEIVSSTSSSGLDQATCRLLERRARFDAATDANGAKVVGTYSGAVTWRIPK